MELLKKQCRAPRRFVEINANGQRGASPSRYRRVLVQLTEKVTHIITMIDDQQQKSPGTSDVDLDRKLLNGDDSTLAEGTSALAELHRSLIQLRNETSSDDEEVEQLDQKRQPRTGVEVQKINGEKKNGTFGEITQINEFKRADELPMTQIVPVANQTFPAQSVEGQLQAKTDNFGEFGEAFIFPTPSGRVDDTTAPPLPLLAETVDTSKQPGTILKDVDVAAPQPVSTIKPARKLPVLSLVVADEGFTEEKQATLAQISPTPIYSTDSTETIPYLRRSSDELLPEMPSSPPTSESVGKLFEVCDNRTVLETEADGKIEALAVDLNLGAREEIADAVETIVEPAIEIVSQPHAIIIPPPTDKLPSTTISTNTMEDKLNQTSKSIEEIREKLRTDIEVVSSLLQNPSAQLQEFALTLAHVNEDLSNAQSSLQMLKKMVPSNVAEQQQQILCKDIQKLVRLKQRLADEYENGVKIEGIVIESCHLMERLSVSAIARADMLEEERKVALSQEQQSFPASSSADKGKEEVSKH